MTIFKLIHAHPNTPAARITKKTSVYGKNHIKKLTNIAMSVAIKIVASQEANIINSDFRSPLSLILINPTFRFFYRNPIDLWVT